MRDSMAYHGSTLALPDSLKQTFAVCEHCESGLLDIKRCRSAGTKTNRGYWQLCHKRKCYRAHRVVWFLVTGEDPGDQVIDHVNGDGLDNRFDNLRVCDQKDNMRNSKKSRNNAQKYKGVSKHGNRGYQARIGVNGKQIALGTFSTQEEAAEAYNLAAKEYHGEYARLNEILN